ncbi:hypothetical protein C8J57DRAFT_1011299, partial [Mycena rebaudengoi]
VTFLIRPYDGLTRTLHDTCFGDSEEQTVPAKVYLEGPYGHDHDLGGHDCLLFISGGVGVTFTLSCF